MFTKSLLFTDDASLECQGRVGPFKYRGKAAERAATCICRLSRKVYLSLIRQIGSSGDLTSP